MLSQTVKAQQAKRKPMQAVIEDLVARWGLTDELEKCQEVRGSFWLEVKNPPWQRLVIEVTPLGEIAVAHTFVQEGDLMRDPEIVYDADWYPVEITQDPVGSWHRAPEGRYLNLGGLGSIWPRNIKAQGFLETQAVRARWWNPMDDQDMRFDIAMVDGQPVRTVPQEG